MSKTKKNQVQNTQNSNTSAITSNKKGLLDQMWSAVLIFIVGTLLLGLLASFAGGNMKAYLSLSRPPFSALPICFFVTRLLMYLALGFAIYYVYRKPNRKKYNRIVDLICFYTQLALVFFFPLFFFRLGSHIFATVWLGVSIVLAIITLVRFWANNKISGILYTIYTVWLLYLFYVALGVCLLK